jgi:pimeloyl-[acyl-carrier protein] methyl ester esterase
MSKLAVEVLGHGPPLVMLHGWALNSGVFLHVVDALAARHTLHLVDLPGHGANATVMPGTALADWAAAVRAVVPAPAAWLGWSLGGVVALRAALDAPDEVSALTLVASTPRFLTASDWPAAQAPAAVERVAQGLATDYARTVRDFLALQVLGDEHAQGSLRELKAALGARPAPSAAALSVGLEILRDTDLRAEVPTLHVPLLAVMGRMDRLTPPAAGEWLADHALHGRCVVMPKVAHAPFMSHPEAFLATLTPFLAEAA